MDATVNRPIALPIRLRPKRSKRIVLLAGALAFVAGGVWMIRDGEWMGWLVAGFFGLCSLIFLVGLHPNSTSLTISPEGLEIRNLFRTTTLRWTEISGFGIYVMRHGMATHKMVGFNYSANYQQASKGRAIAQALSGFEGALPDTYGMSVEGLAAMLSAIHRERTGG